MSKPFAIVQVEEALERALKRRAAPAAPQAGLPAEKLGPEGLIGRSGPNRSRAAEVLGIDRCTLHRMAERFGTALDEAER